MQVVTLTMNAIKELNYIIENQELDKEKVCLRLRVVGGGCNGFQTKLDLDETCDENKDNIDVVEGIKVVVDKRSSLYIQGASVDFHDGLDKRGFIVENPTAKSTCNCGSSFDM